MCCHKGPAGFCGSHLEMFAPHSFEGSRSSYWRFRRITEAKREKDTTEPPKAPLCLSREPFSTWSPAISWWSAHIPVSSPLLTAASLSHQIKLDMETDNQDNPFLKKKYSIYMIPSVYLTLMIGNLKRNLKLNLWTHHNVLSRWNKCELHMQEISIWHRNPLNYVKRHKSLDVSLMPLATGDLCRLKCDSSIYS